MTASCTIQPSLLSNSMREQAVSAERVNITDSPQPSNSQSTPTSSPGSIILGRPPLGWQKKILFSQKETVMKQGEGERMSDVSSPSSAGTFFGDEASNTEHSGPYSLHSFWNILKLISCAFVVRDPNVKQLIQLQLSPSPRSSSGSESPTSVIDALIPIDAKERIMKAVSSQNLPSNTWLPPSIASTRTANFLYSVAIF